MKTRQLIKSTLLISILFISGCRETTSTQRDYTTARDECREMSELRMQSRSMSQRIEPQSQEYKKQLLTSFSDCMGKQGWAVTGPDKNKPGQEVDISAIPPKVQVAPLTSPPAVDYRIKRAAECAYARQAEFNSSNARAIARACEMECKSQRKLAPDAPIPAACAP